MRRITTFAAIAAVICIAFGINARADTLTCAAGQSISITCGAVTPVPVPPSPPGPVPPPPPAPAPPPPPPSGWSGVCPGFDATRVIDMSWTNPVRMYTSQVGGFGANNIVVVRFTTGASPSGANKLAIASAEYQGPPTRRIAALSTLPCDFVGVRDPSSGQPWWGATVSNSTSVSVYFTVDNPNNGGYYPILRVNTPYFFNVKNAPDQCAGVCDADFDLAKYGNP